MMFTRTIGTQLRSKAPWSSAWFLLVTSRLASGREREKKSENDFMHWWTLRNREVIFSEKCFLNMWLAENREIKIIKCLGLARIGLPAYKASEKSNNIVQSAAVNGEYNLQCVVVEKLVFIYATIACVDETRSNFEIEIKFESKSCFLCLQNLTQKQSSLQMHFLAGIYGSPGKENITTPDTIN